jgi:hypothetical protein
VTGAGWHEVGIAVREIRTDFAESAQGVATDGHRWFVVSNRAVVGLMRKLTDPRAVFEPHRNCRRVGVYDAAGRKLSEIAPSDEVWAELVRRNRSWPGPQDVHLGAPDWSGGALFVPTQRPSGVWVVPDGPTAQEWWPDPEPVHPERFSWIARHPGNGLLYTSVHWHPRELQALEEGTLRRRPAADIRLGPTTPAPDRVQGGAFSSDGRVLLSSSVGQGQVFVYAVGDGSALQVLTGFGFREMEGLAVHPMTVAGQPADVHILDAATQYWPFLRWGDSFAVRSFRT